MQCREVYRFICDNLDQAVDSPECMAMRRHIEGCGDCRAYLASLKQTIGLYQAGPTAGIPPAVHRRLMSAIRTCFDPAPHPRRKDPAPARRARHGH